MVRALLQCVALALSATAVAAGSVLVSNGTDDTWSLWSIDTHTGFTQSGARVAAHVPSAAAL